MKELQQVVNAQIEKMIDDGSVENMIAEKVKDSIKSAIDDSLKSYSDFGRALKDKVEESLNQSVNRISLPEYNKFISDVVVSSFEGILEEQGKAQIKELLEDSLKPVPKEISATDLLDEVKEIWSEDDSEYDEITIDWDRGTYSILIEFNHPEYDFENVKVSLYNFNEESEDIYHVGYIHCSATGKLTTAIKTASAINHLANYFFKLYCNKTSVTGLHDIYGQNIELSDY